MIEAVIIHAINVCLGILIAAMWNKIRQQKVERNEAEKEIRNRMDRTDDALRSLLRLGIIKAYDEVVTQGKPMSVGYKGALQDCHTIYEGFGKNGFITHEWDAILEYRPGEKKNGRNS